MIQKDRIIYLNKNPVLKEKFVVYWMQASQRVEYNHALEFSIRTANELNKPLIVFFSITDNFPEANERHYYFMLEGLREISSSLKTRGIQMVIWHESPEKGIINFSKNTAVVITDRGYLRIQKFWRDYAAKNLKCLLIQVESDVIVPIQTASQKEEYSAATLRPKIKKLLNAYLLSLNENKIKKDSLGFKFSSLNINSIDKIIKELKIDNSVNKSQYYEGGSINAKFLLDDFIKNKLVHFHDLRNDPSVDYISNMSPYLHFGQISPLYIALEISKVKWAGVESYLEELIVRRELAMNFVFYNDYYESFNCLHKWSKATLNEHIKDKREFIYKLEDFENAKTHDSYWNAAQKEMVIKGKMHGYMRMYWGKKIIEWTNSPEEAFKIALYLNNKYELDGRDPNGFTGVAWCFGKHDRAWSERPIFGKIRYMNENGLKRKFDIDKYVTKISLLEKEINNAKNKY